MQNLRVVLLKQATMLNVSFTKIIELNKPVLSLGLYIVRIWCGIVLNSYYEDCWQTAQDENTESHVE